MLLYVMPNVLEYTIHILLYAMPNVLEYTIHILLYVMPNVLEYTIHILLYVMPNVLEYTIHILLYVMPNVLEYTIHILAYGLAYTHAYGQPIRIWDSPYAYGKNTHMGRNIYSIYDVMAKYLIIGIFSEHYYFTLDIYLANEGSYW